MTIGSPGRDHRSPGDDCSGARYSTQCTRGVTRRDSSARASARANSDSGEPSSSDRRSDSSARRISRFAGPDVAGGYGSLDTNSKLRSTLGSCEQPLRRTYAGPSNGGARPCDGGGGLTVAAPNPARVARARSFQPPLDGRTAGPTYCVRPPGNFSPSRARTSSAARSRFAGSVMADRRLIARKSVVVEAPVGSFDLRRRAVQLPHPDVPDEHSESPNRKREDIDQPQHAARVVGPVRTSPRESRSGHPAEHDEAYGEPGDDRASGVPTVELSRRAPSSWRGRPLAAAYSGVPSSARRARASASSTSPATFVRST